MRLYEKLLHFKHPCDKTKNKENLVKNTRKKKFLFKEKKKGEKLNLKKKQVNKTNFVKFLKIVNHKKKIFLSFLQTQRNCADLFFQQLR